MNHDPIESFSINGHAVEVEYKPVSGEGFGAIREQIRKDDFYAAETRAIVFGVDELKYDGKLIIRKRTRTERRGGASVAEAESIPMEWDAEGDKALWDLIIGKVVARNEWLAQREPFKTVFADYADEDAPKQNPTKLHDATAKTGS